MKTLIDQIDHLLPQTQCGLCEYTGCRPYAEAIAKQEVPINRCLPGGIKTLKALADLMHQDPSAFMIDMEKKTKSPTVAVIREAECIGCTKCIQACPTDAIIGASKLMHTVISDACTGCELCLAPCPVDCISLLPREEMTAEKNKLLWKDRHEQHLHRAKQEKTKATEPYQSLKIETRQAAILDAVSRAKAKKLRQGHEPNPT